MLQESTFWTRRFHLHRVFRERSTVRMGSADTPASVLNTNTNAVNHTHATPMRFHCKQGVCADVGKYTSHIPGCVGTLYSFGKQKICSKNTLIPTYSSAVTTSGLAKSQELCVCLNDLVFLPSVLKVIWLNSHFSAKDGYYVKQTVHILFIWSNADVIIRSFWVGVQSFDIQMVLWSEN